MPRLQTRWLGQPACRGHETDCPRRGRCMPAMARISEVLPAPLAPTMVTIAPPPPPARRRRASWASPWTVESRLSAASAEGLRHPDRNAPLGIAHHRLRCPCAMTAPWWSTSRRTQSHHGPHHVLDHEDGGPLPVELAQDRDHPVGLGRPQPAMTSSSKQQRGCVASARADLEPLAIGSVTHWRAGAFVDRSRRRNVSCACARAASDGWPAQQCADHDIVLDVSVGNVAPIGRCARCAPTDAGRVPGHRCVPRQT